MVAKTERKEDVIKTDGAHTYTHLGGQWWSCDDCLTKVSAREIDDHIHRHRCKGDHR